MPRSTRKKSKTGIYHVMLRGINRQDIFEDEEDYRKMLSCLEGLVERCNEKGQLQPALCTIYAYCLMSNHIHLLVRERDFNLSEIVKRIGVAYAYYFNKKYDRYGHLFQDRFKSEPVGQESPAGWKTTNGAVGGNTWAEQLKVLPVCVTFSTFSHATTGLPWRN